MTSTDVFEVLSVHPFTASLQPSWQRRLATAGRPVAAGAGTRLFRQDTVADRFWLLQSGAVAIDLHVPGSGDVVLERVEAGSVVGWSWSGQPYRWRFGAVVADDLDGVEFDAYRVRRLMATDVDFGRELGSRLLAVVADRLEAARHRLVEYTGAARSVTGAVGASAPG